MVDYYQLNEDRSVTPIDDPREWAKAYEDHDKRRVARTEFAEGAWVSTVFLGLNHAFDQSGPPKIFETMVFPSKEDLSEQLCWRYSTWEQAEAGHAAAAELTRRYLAEGKSLEDLYEEEAPE